MYQRSPPDIGLQHCSRFLDGSTCLSEKHCGAHLATELGFLVADEHLWLAGRDYEGRVVHVEVTRRDGE